MLGAAAGPELFCASLGYRAAIPNSAEPRLYAIPEIVVYDPQLRYIAANPVLARIDSRDPPPRRWILGIAQSIPDEPPNIEFVAQDTGPAERMSADRRVAPRSTARTGYALSVKLGRDPAGALARGKVRKDATNRGRLGLVNLASSALIVFDDPITVAKSST
jgi:hypothetical protein